MNLTERYSKKLENNSYGDVKLDGILVQLEVTNVCNHKCVFCPNADSGRKKTMMDYQLAQRVIKECAEFLGEDKRICFHMNGEPLLYKELPSLIRYSKELGYDYSFITTNGSVGTNRLMAELFDSGLDSIKFSINAGSRETYKLIHGSDDYDNAMDALKFSWRYRKEMGRTYKIYVSCVGTKDNYHELEQLNRYAGQYCDEIVFYYPCHYAGQTIEKSNELYRDLSPLSVKTFEINHVIPCGVLWNSINVTCEGYLSLCCSEAGNRLIVEDINHMGIKEAWLGGKMTAVRNGHLTGSVEHMPCWSCVTAQPYEAENIDQELFALSLKQKGGET